MEADELKVMVQECIDELISEGKIRKLVVRGGQRKRVQRSTNKGQKVVGGHLKTMKAGERVKRSRSAKLTARKMKSKKHRIARKRNKSMKKRHRLGLDHAIPENGEQ